MNLPIATNVSQSAAPKAASASPAQDDQATQSSDPFGSVLARQLAGDSSAADAASSAKTAGTITAAKDKKDDKQAGDVANTPPADMLAALLAAPAAQAAAKPADAAATTVDAKDKTAQLDNGKTALKLPTGVADATHAKSAHKPGIDDKADNFASALNALDSKGRHAAEEMQAKAQPLPQADTPAAASLSQLVQNNPLAAAGSVPAKLTVDTPVGSKDWGNDFGQKITWMASSKEQSAELHLNPPNLGPLDVVLKVSGDQATAMFTSPHAAVREAVEQAMPKLREMMADNGIMLGNATVSDQAPRDNQAGQQSRGQPRISSAASGSDTGSIGGLSQATRSLPAGRHNGLVDTFA